MLGNSCNMSWFKTVYMNTKFFDLIFQIFLVLTALMYIHCFALNDFI